VGKTEKRKEREIWLTSSYLFHFPSGNLLVRSLTDLVDKKNFILGSEFMTTLLVVVSKYGRPLSRNPVSLLCSPPPHPI